MASIHSRAPRITTPSPVIEADQSHLRGRISNPFLKMTPPLLVLIACVTGIVYSALGGSPYLLLAFAPGTLGSIYIIGKECCSQDLRTFSENNESLRNSIGTLRGRIHELETEIDQLEVVNRDLRQTLDNYRAIYSRIREEVLALSEIRERFNAHLQENIQQFGGIRNNFHRTFQTEQNRLQQNVQNLSSHVTQELELQQNMTEEVDRLIQFSETFRNLLNDPAHRQAYEELVALNGRLAETAARIEENANHLEQLREIKVGFQQALDELLQDIRQSNENNIRFEDIAGRIERVLNFQILHPPVLHGA